MTNIRHFAEMAALVLSQKATDMKLRDRYATAADYNDAAEFFKQVADGKRTLLEVPHEQVLRDFAEDLFKAFEGDVTRRATAPRVVVVTIEHDRKFNVWRVSDDGGSFTEKTVYGGNLAAAEADARHDRYIANDETCTVEIVTRNV